MNDERLRQMSERDIQAEMRYQEAEIRIAENRIKAAQRVLLLLREELKRRDVVGENSEQENVK